MSIAKERRRAAKKQEKIQGELRGEAERKDAAIKVGEKLTQRILMGKKFREQMNVQTRDGTPYTVTVRPIDEAQVFEILESAPGVKFEKGTIKYGSQSQRVHLLHRFAIEGLKCDDQNFTLDLLREALLPGELLRIGTRVVEISRIGEVEVKQIGSFRKQ